MSTAERTPTASPAEDPLWYKHGVVYQLHVRSFYDGNGDGTGDFGGLMQKLDYLQWLGVDVVWLLPFYPSPLRDDGYDVSDYRAVNPAYGTMNEVRAFVREAHARGIRVITELILNHTSDQHPWFQRARRAKPGSRARNYYVWSDDDQKFAGTRIIFTDTETSNWAWDPVAGQYYWHRFFSHQPDLNFENPEVVREMIAIMRFWFRLGVDGLRLDAVPYLCVSEGTSNENIPETHAVIKALRAFIEAEFPGRILLAEANQWPEDVQTYFGAGDECQMAYHFPLMPRLFLSLATQDRFPIYDIMQQTPEIPESCQWAIFLRNHDEMTLEMVTDRERAFMYEVYAPEHHARINVGIRRRLAPLLGNDRRKIELLMSFLLSMPGTPILYYGDEIGMGDNVFLKDRDGVRTPMQWSPDRNGGFSRADAQRVCLPVVQDSIYGYEATNVEAQRRDGASLLNWVRRLVGVRQAHRLFGEGRLTFLYPENRHIIAYLRELGDETVLCVANLAESAQAVTLDLSRFVGRTPVEMIGWSAFPRIGEREYPVTLPGNAFFWFLLRNEPAMPEAAPRMPTVELETIVLPRGWHSLPLQAPSAQLERSVLPKYLPRQRWFGAGRPLPARVAIVDMVELSDGDDGPILVLMRADDEARTLTLLLDRSFDLMAAPAGGPGASLAKGRTGPREFLVYEAAADARPWPRLARAALRGQSFHGRSGRIACEPFGEAAGLVVRSDDPVRRVAGDAAVAGVVDERVVVRLYRSVEAGPHPEIELATALRRAGFDGAPEYLGFVGYEGDDGARLALGCVYRFFGERGDGREIALDLLRRRLERARETPAPGAADRRDDDGFGGLLRYAALVGRRLAAFHRVFLDPEGDETTRPTATTAQDAEREVEATLRLMPEGLSKATYTLVKRAVAEGGAALVGAVACRVHGGLTLAELAVGDDDVRFVGLEGDARESLAERRRKRPPAVDLASLSVSFDLAADEVAGRVASDRTEDDGRARPLAADLARQAREALFAGYEEGTIPLPRPALQFFRFQALLRTHARPGSGRELPVDSLEGLLRDMLDESGLEDPS